MVIASADPFSWLTSEAPAADSFDAQAWLADYNAGARPWDGLTVDVTPAEGTPQAKKKPARDVVGPVVFIIALGALWALWGRPRSG